jgi:hypothetical protein
VAEWAIAGGECTLSYAYVLSVRLRHFYVIPNSHSLQDVHCLSKKHHHAKVVAYCITMRACEISERQLFDIQTVHEHTQDKIHKHRKSTAVPRTHALLQQQPPPLTSAPQQQRSAPSDSSPPQSHSDQRHHRD